MKKSGKFHDTKKKAAGTAAAITAGAGLLLGGLFQSPADLMDDAMAHAAPPPAIEWVMPAAADNGGDHPEEESFAQDERRRLGIRDSLRQLIAGLPPAVKAFIGVPLWALGSLATAAFSSLWSIVLSPVLSTAATWLLAAGVVLAAVLGTVKAVFPDMPVKKILTKRMVLSVIATVAVFGCADAVLPFTFERYEEIRGIFRAAVAFVTAAGASVVLVLRCSGKNMRKRETSGA